MSLRLPSPSRKATRVADVYRRLLTSSLWTTGPLAGLGDRARLLWLRLATGPESTAIPGLMFVRVADIARSLGWAEDEVARVSTTIPAAALRADWSAGVAWIPALLRWQPPGSSKNVLGWVKTWASLPATPIAEEIYEELRLCCAGRGASCARAFAELAAPAPAAPPAAVPATIEIRGVSVTASGIPEGQQAAVVRELARSLGVEIQVLQPAVALAAAPEPAKALPLPALAAYTPAPRQRRTKIQAVLEDRRADLDRVLAYQADRRAAAFELAGRPPTPIDEDDCRRQIAALLAAGKTVVECETVCDRLYERVGAERSPAAKMSAAAWWTATAWHPARFAEVLRLEVGAAAPAGVGALAKAINGAAPPGAPPISALSASETRHLSHLLELGKVDAEILATATVFATIVAEQERQLARRELAKGEARLVRLWGGRMFRLGAWSAVQTAVEQFDRGERGVELFVELTAAIQADGAAARARSG